MWIQRTAIGTIILLIVGALATSPAQAFPTPPHDTWTTASIDLATDALAYDPLRDQVLVAVSSVEPVIGNSLVELDPHTGAIGRVAALGSRVVDLAIADDASRAYAALGDVPAVVEIDLATFTTTRTIQLGATLAGGAFFPFDVEVQPGHPDVVAIARSNGPHSSGFRGVAIYDDGIKRGVETTAGQMTSSLTWSDDPGVLYGYNGMTSEFGLRRLVVDSAGVHQTAMTSPFSFFFEQILFGNGRIHASDGEVVDATTMTLDGAYTHRGLMALDDATAKTYIITDTGGLYRHDGLTYLEDWRIEVPAIDYRGLVDAGDVLAARSSTEVVLIGPGASATGFAPPVAPAPSVAVEDTLALPMEPNAIAASPDGTRVYAAVGNAAASYPGEVVEIDVATRTVSRHVFVGGDPGSLAVTDDGSRVIVGHRTANRITELDALTLTIARTVPLGPGELAPAIEPRPRDPDGYVVASGSQCCGAAREAYLVNAGTIRPTRMPGPTAVAFLDDAARLYGYNGGDTGFEFFVMQVGNTGITQSGSVATRVVEGFHLRFRTNDGLLYSSRGEVVDPEVPARVGAFAAEGPPLILPVQERVLFADDDELLEFDLDARWLVGVHPIDTEAALVDAVTTRTDVVIAHADGLRFVPIVAPADPQVPPTLRTLAPVRLFDSRGSNGPHLLAGSVTEVAVSGAHGVPSDATTAVLNLTATQPMRSGHLTVFPCGQPRPNTSNLNYAKSQTIGNTVLAQLSPTGTTCIYTPTATHLVIDLSGYVPGPSSYNPTTPTRLRDTRSGLKPAAGSITEIPVTGVNGVPNDATTAVLNITATQPANTGYLTVFPCGQPRPTTSNLNYARSQTIGNTVIAQLSPTGTTCIYTPTATHLVVDLNGHITPPSSYTATAPTRLRDTRSGPKPTAGSVTEIAVTGAHGVPIAATSAVLNITATQPASASHLTVYPCDQPRPNTSSLNFAKSQTIGNTVLAQLSPTGTTCIYSPTATHLVIDLNGWL